MSEGVLGIVGTGLIGGSIGLRARRNGWRAIGYDVHPAALAQALDGGAIDASVSQDELYARADAVVLAAHLGATCGELERLRGFVPRAALILDVASVKATVVAAAHGVEHFVATHPMAGAERSGARAARADLFDGRIWAYVPSGKAGLDALARDFIVSMGGVALAVEAELHDRAVALTSHLPQLAGSVYAQLMHAAGGEATGLSGPAARELLRVSRMSFAMWGDVLFANAANVELQLRAYASGLAAAADALRDGDTAAVRRLFAPESLPEASAASLTQGRPPGIVS